MNIENQRIELTHAGISRKTGSFKPDKKPEGKK